MTLREQHPDIFGTFWVDIDAKVPKRKSFFFLAFASASEYCDFEHSSVKLVFIFLHCLSRFFREIFFMSSMFVKVVVILIITILHSVFGFVIVCDEMHHHQSIQCYFHEHNAISSAHPRLPVVECIGMSIFNAYRLTFKQKSQVNGDQKYPLTFSSSFRTICK